MSLEILALGVSHKTASLDLREKLALPEGRAEMVVAELMRDDAIAEAVSISTCNRTELYLVTPDSVEAESTVLRALSRLASIRPIELTGALYSLHGTEAITHLFSVTAGLDSMIVGEAEIQGQVKRSYETALTAELTGPVTNRLFRDALAAGKRVRTETAIGSSHTSISTVSVELAGGPLGGLEGRRALIVGTGEQGELTAQALRDKGAEITFVAGRRYDRAIGLAQRYGGTAARFDDLPAQLQDADVLVSVTASPHHIVGRDDLEPLLSDRFERPLVVLDLAVPRDVEPEVRELCGVSLFDMDDLEEAVAKNVEGRVAEVPLANEIVAAAVAEFEEWARSLDVLPTVAALRKHAEGIAAQVVRDNASRFDSLSDDDRERLDTLARAIVTRILHEPTLRLKEAAGSDESLEYVQLLHTLFGLDEAQDEAGDAGAEVADLDQRRRRRA